MNDDLYRTFDTSPLFKRELAALQDEIRHSRDEMNNTPKDGIFWHKCAEPDCIYFVEFDDEPFCFKHSPDSGSSVKGYSAMREQKGNSNGDTQ